MRLQTGDLMCVDPTLKEEASADGSMTATINTHGEVCAVQKAHGIGLRLHQVLPCVVSIQIHPAC